jgi:protein TonB
MSPRNALAAKRHTNFGGMQRTADQPRTATAQPGKRRLPATTLPERRESRRGWGLLSMLLHVLVIALLVAPAALHTGNVIERAQGAGGRGPAGGGGGGRQGTGGTPQVHYVRVEAAQPTPPAVLPPKVMPPKPQPKPVVPPPQVKPPEPQLVEPKVDIKPDAPKQIAAIDPAPVPGAGGGTGRDGSAGNGPGSGGGVGSGIGPGHGSGIGPGTGGGIQANYPPTPTELFIPPLPMPDKVRGFHLVAEYDVDSTGKVLDFHFTPTRDGGYNKRLDEVLRSFKFRPGTTPQGVPIRMKAQIIYDF